jgi:hypothetical protein
MTDSDKGAKAMNDDMKMTVTGDDGGAGVVDNETLQVFITDLDEINSETGQIIRQKQREADDVRFCRWPGQSPDGRRWSETLKKAGRKGADAEAFPFDGAPDSRVRLADFVTNFRAGVRFLSVLRASGIPQVFGTEGQDIKVAGKVKLLLRHIIRNQWGPHFLRQVMLSAQYVENHDPGGCIVMNWWRREYGLEMEEVTLQTVAERMLEAAQANPPRPSGTPPAEGSVAQAGGNALIDAAVIENIEAAIQLLTTPGREREAADFLVSLFPDVKPARARKMVKELQADGETEFPKRVVAVNQPDVRTMKLFEDVFIRSNAVDLEHTPVHMPELLTPVQLRERVVSQGYDAKAVDELLGEGAFQHAGNSVGKTKLFETDQQYYVNQYGESTDPYKGYVEVIRTIYKASNEDGMPVWCVVQWTPHLQSADGSTGGRALTERETLFAHNQFPGVFISSETISKYLLDARSSAERAGADQSLLKMFTDLAGAAGQLKSFPPIEEAMSRPGSYETGIRPLGRIKRKKAGDIAVMKMGEYSRENTDSQDRIVRRVCEYFGIPHAEVSPVITDVEQQVMTLFFCAAWAQLMSLTVKLCQENMEDSEIARITGPDGAPIAESVEEIRGGWNVQLSYAPSDLDPEQVEMKLKMISEFALRWDTLSTADRAKLVQMGFYLIDPALADGVLLPEEMASAKEIEDEQRIFTMIVAAGVEPERVTEGKNFGLRLQWLQQQMQQNPEPIMNAPETNRLILEAHLAHYEQMVTQQQNVQVGREGSARVLG